MKKITVELRDSNNILKFKFDNQTFDDLFSKGALDMTKKSTKNFVDGSVTAFTFTDDVVFNSPFGKLYFWENDYIAIKGL
jgi:hypothetical protein